MLSALCFALFGRGYGSITKQALVNSINQKQLVVSVEFIIGNKKYKIVRGIKPNIFEIYENDKLINQNPSIKDYQKILEQQILKFNYRAFTQVVAVGGGSDYIPFMKLSAKDRREFIEDLLDIRVFSIMNSLIKDQIKESKDELKNIDYSLKSIKEKIILQESFIAKMKKEKMDSEDKILSNIKEMQKKDEELSNTISKLMISLNDYEQKVNEYNDLDEKLTEIRLSQKQLNSLISNYKEKQEFYEDLTICPTCTQSVSGENKQAIVKSIISEIDKVNEKILEIKNQELELRKIIESYQKHLTSFKEIQEKISELNKEQISIKTSIINAKQHLEYFQSDMNSIDSEIEKQKLFAKEYLSFDKKKKMILELQVYQDFIQQLLSDSGIKAKIIKQYIPTINKLINKYLAELDFFVSFHLDEQFNETIKSRHRDTFTYDNFSEGQKRRIDLAILLTWVEIAKAKNALSTNIIFFDEIDAPLDAAGSDMLHAALKSCPSENIFIVSHKGDLLADKVDDVISFRIHNNFTEITS